MSYTYVCNEWDTRDTLEEHVGDVASKNSGK